MNNSLTLRPTIIDQALRRDPRIKSQHTRRQYASHLRAFEGWRDGQPLTKTLVKSYLAGLQEQGLAPATINQKLAAIRWWASQVIDLAYDNLDDEKAAQVSKQAARVLTVGVVKGSRPKRGRHLKGSEFVDLMRACLRDKSPAGTRDAALFALAWTTGLRREEFTALKIEHITPMEETNDDGTITHYGEIQVHGKGDKTRPAYLINGAYEALQDWLTVRGHDPGYVFCPVRKGGVPSPSYDMSGEALRLILEGRQKQAGIRRHLTWHDFRRTFAGNLLDANNDLSTVQELMGHVDPKTTSGYDRRPEKRKRIAVQALRMPKISEEP